MGEFLLDELKCLKLGFEALAVVVLIDEKVRGIDAGFLQ